MTTLVSSIKSEYSRYKALAEGALSQLTDAELSVAGPGGGNAIAIICRHIAGNLRSRFTDFLTSDGEKPWRHREEEFQTGAVTRAELLEHWQRGWDALFDALAGLTDDHLTQTVTIRGQPLQVHEALHRSLAHASYHVGQVVFAARGIRGAAWRFLSIPPGRSDEYNAKPTLENPEAHTAALRRPLDPGVE